MIYGKKKTIDQFVDKLTETIETKISDYKAFIELQRECVQILENFNDKWSTDLEGMRRLSYFRLQVKHLLHNHFKTKDAVEFEHQIMGSMEYLIDFLDMYNRKIQMCSFSNSDVQKKHFFAPFEPKTKSV